MTVNCYNQEETPALTSQHGSGVILLKIERKYLNKTNVSSSNLHQCNNMNYTTFMTRPATDCVYWIPSH